MSLTLTHSLAGTTEAPTWMDRGTDRLTNEWNEGRMNGGRTTASALVCFRIILPFFSLVLLPALTRETCAGLFPALFLSLLVPLRSFGSLGSLGSSSCSESRLVRVCGWCSSGDGAYWSCCFCGCFGVHGLVWAGLLLAFTLTDCLIIGDLVVKPLGIPSIHATKDRRKKQLEGGGPTQRYLSRSFMSEPRAFKEMFREASQVEEKERHKPSLKRPRTPFSLPPKKDAVWMDG